jgi:hypothetical protein
MAEKKPLKPRTPMSRTDLIAADALWRIRKKVNNGFERGFVGTIHRAAEYTDKGLTDRQRAWLWELVWRYLPEIEAKGIRWFAELQEIAVSRHSSFELREGMRRLRRKARKQEIERVAAIPSPLLF